MAAYMRKSAAVLMFQLRQIFSSWRIPCIFILTDIFVWINAQQAGDFAKAVGLGVRPWLFCHLTNDFICQLVFAAACVALFCDAPWDTGMSSYILPRAGKSPQCAGHILYIAAMSLLLTAFIFLVSAAAPVPYLEFGKGWGKALGTLARTSAGAEFGLSFTVNDYLIGAYSPGKATLLSFLLEWACFAWLGLVVYLFNRNIHKMSGIFAAAAFILLDVTVANELTPFAYHFSPITLAQLTSLVGMNARLGVTLRYAAMFFGCGIPALALINIAMARRKIK